MTRAELHDDELIARRHLPAEPGRVWAAFTSPASIAAFWGGSHATVPPESVTVDLRPGGEFVLDPAGITKPVAVWHGGQDRMVPFEHGRWLAEHIPGALAHLHPDQGHLSLVVTHIDDVIDSLGSLASSS